MENTSKKIRYGVPVIDDTLDALRDDFKGDEISARSLNAYVEVALEHRANLTPYEMGRFDDIFLVDVVDFGRNINLFQRKQPVFVALIFLGVFASGALGTFWHDKGLLFATVCAAVAGLCFIAPVVLFMAKTPYRRGYDKTFVLPALGFAGRMSLYCLLTAFMTSGYAIYGRPFVSSIFGGA